MPKQDNDLSVVLSGAGGFLGRHVLSAMLAEGIHVKAISSKSVSELEQLCDADFSKSDVIVIDSADEEHIRTYMTGADVFLNCAFPRHTDGMHLAQGLSFISKLFMLAADCNVGSVINISSHSLYGLQSTETTTEEAPLYLESTYATAKYATELMLDASCKDIPHVNIRLASLIGPGFDQRVVNKMVKRALNEGTVEVAENGSRFGYLDVDDAARALILLIQSDPFAWRGVYNVGTKQDYSLTDIAEAVCQAIQHDLGKDCTIKMIGPTAEPIMSVCSSEIFCSQFDWTAACALEDTIKKIIQYELNINVSNTTGDHQ